jgi:hypothetical protein
VEDPAQKVLSQLLDLDVHPNIGILAQKLPDWLSLSQSSGNAVEMLTQGRSGPTFLE